MRTGEYWTSSYFEGDYGNRARKITSSGRKLFENDYKRIIGARPAIPLLSKFKIPTNGEAAKKIGDGKYEVEYGFYPQEAATTELQGILETAFENKELQMTGNKYTTDSRDIDDIEMNFKPMEHQEYQYNGNKYIRAKIKSRTEDEEVILSNGGTYKEGDNVWIEVSPVKWLVDLEAYVMITEKIMFAGVPFNQGRFVSFEKTVIKGFMDNFFSKDLIQSLEKEQQFQTKEESNNQYNLQFNEVSESDIIRGAIQSDVAIFLHGKPGCGKSDRVKQLDPDFVELNLSLLDPELLDGLAGEKDGKAVHIKPPWLDELEEKCQEEPDKIHILFLEELTNASPMMQSKAYGIALDKKVTGKWKLPENARVVAAGNELEDSLAANEMPQPLYDRFAHINIETTVDSWLEWAVTPESFYEKLDYERQEKLIAKIHPAIYAYVSYRGESVLRTPYNREKPEPHADPRRWKMASDMLYATKNPNTLTAIVGEELTEDFKEFCRLPTITIQDVIDEEYDEEDLEIDLGRKLATITGLLKVDDENMPKVREFVKKLGPEMCKKFEVQWAGGNEERINQIYELRLMEKEEHENDIKHTAKEAEKTSELGVLAYDKINGNYEKYLVREENRKNEEKNEK